MDDALKPLGHSHSATQVEQELKELFVRLYAQSLKPVGDDIDVYGAPHLGTFDLVARNIDQDGLTVLRDAGEERIRYLLKAWRHRNPERGLFFLRLYLAALFSGYAEVSQLWHDKVSTYPLGVRTGTEVTTNGGNLDDYYLTSRVRVDLDTDMVPAKLLASMRSVVAARILLNVRIGKFTRVGVGVASVGYGVNILRMSWQARPGDFATIAVEGSLPIYVPGTPYEGRLDIKRARGVCVVQWVGGDPLPAGTTITVDQPARQVVIAWPESSRANTPLEITVKVTDGRGKEAFWFGTIDEQLVYLTSRLYPLELIEPEVTVSPTIIGFEHRNTIKTSEVVEPGVDLSAAIVGFVHRGMPSASSEEAVQVAPAITGFVHKMMPNSAVEEGTVMVQPTITEFVHRTHPNPTVEEPTVQVSPTITGFIHA